MSAEPIAARVYRGTSIEAEHAASVAVVNARGELTHAFGDPERSFALRSATKPFQAIPLVVSGAVDAFGLDQRELAVACASHSGSDRHVEVVRGLLARAGAGPEALRCGSHLPFELRRRNELPKHGEDRDPLRHNCSGKHAGFLLVTRHVGEPLETYLEPESAVQRLARAAVADACELSPDELATAVDGCSAPTFACSLVALARGFKNLAAANAADPERARALERVRDAMLAEPWFVSGDGRFDYDLARSFPMNVVNKSGAEAIVALGFRDPPLGIVVKVHDGGERALAPITVAVLRELGLVDDIARFPLLATHERPPVTNHRKLSTGEIVA
ncbi:MAG TPA: asparaginase, partial [Polyangiaceae bacterium]